MADITDINSAQTVKIVGSDATGVEQTPVASTPAGGIHSNLRDESGIEKGIISNPLYIDGVIESKSDLYSSFSPDPSYIFEGLSNTKLDASGRLETHSTVVTDEGSFRDDYLGTTLFTNLSGLVTFTNNSMSITGASTSFTTQLKNGSYLKKTSDSETLFVRVSSIVSDTELELEAEYTGSTATVSAHGSLWKTTTGPGSFAVSNSIATIASGTAAGTITLYRDADYGPFTVSFKTAISQRIANQTVKIGVQTPVVSPTRSAIFSFTGTDNTALNCISSSGPNAADTQTTAVFLPNNLTSASIVEYVINVSNDQITFVINGVTVASHRDHIVGAYDFLQTIVEHTSSGVVTNTNITVDWINFYNINQLEITNNFIGEPLVIAPISVIENRISTYSAAADAFTAPATPTDVFTIRGSSTRVVRVKRISVSLSATNANSYNIQLVKRSTDNTGGTSAVVTAVPNDSDDPVSTAEVRRYTANPTLGTLIGAVRIFKMVVPQAVPLGGASNGPINELIFGSNSGKSIILRGTSELLAINFRSTTLAGNSIVAYVEWTEESV